MENFSKEEVAFIRNSISNGVRIDLRKNHEERKTIHVPSCIAQSDGHVRLRRGSSEADVSVQFKESSEMLLALRLVGEEFNLDEALIETSFPLPRLVSNAIHGFLYEHKIGMRIDFNVISDDGNMYDLFFLGLSTIFQDMEIPVWEDLQKTNRSTLDVPISKTFALIEGSLVNDPTIIEEEASCGLIHVFIGGKKEILGCFSEKNCSLDHNMLIDILQAVAI